ncbi:hypothetical protein HNV08_02670 [Winogradskyella eckloniae]|uniref:CsgG/HfaB family protein n=1 Tax=Winogradskyella eckloniae TaxID=1089306 RepID=UPI001565D2E0|nr:CsgG/HfaB family protein [Winogradskyella eckloniae]NRD18938.1 hypothetical protein [Winogradskyella eckloniae]
MSTINLRIGAYLKKICFLILLILLSNLNTLKAQDSDLFNSDWNKVTITRKVTPEFNLVPYKNLIIAEILNDRSRQNNETSILYNKIAAEIHKIPNVTLLDREKTNLILQEYKLQSSGHVEENYTTPFGKFFSSGIIMIGRIVNSDYKREVNSFKALNGKTKRYRKGIQNLSISIQLIDIKTTQIVYSKTVDAKYAIETKPDYNTPPAISENEVFLGCVEKLIVKFKNLFVAHEVDFKIKFQKNSKFNDDLKDIAALVQVEEFELAHEKLKAILNNKKVVKSEKALSSAYYNLAMLELYTDKYLEAKKNAKMGYLKNPNNNECLKLIKILQ